MDHPSLLFLEPNYFETAELPAPLRAHQTQLTEIKKRVFDAP
jgi:hypothetical protein